MRALVTGGTGFIGSNITLELLRRGYEVVITGSHVENKLPEFKGKILTGDLSTIDWSQAGKVDAVFHQAANNDTTDLNRERMFATNVEAGKRLFMYAKDTGCKRIVYASSTAVYGDVQPPYKEAGNFHPLNPYAESKLAFDVWAASFMEEHPEMRIVGLRYCNVYGPRESSKGKRATMIYQLCQQMKTGNPRIFKYGEQKRDYIYAKDVVSANLLAAAAKESCIVNCGFGKATTFNRLVDLLNKHLNLSRKPQYIDNPYAGKYQDYTECDMSLAKEKIGFVPKFDIGAGISDYFASGRLD